MHARFSQTLLDEMTEAFRDPSWPSLGYAWASGMARIDPDESRTVIAVFLFRTKQEAEQFAEQASRNIAIAAEPCAYAFDITEMELDAAELVLRPHGAEIRLSLSD